MGGRSPCRARAITDLAVPRRPTMSAPPNPGSTASSNSANLMASCPTIAVKGKVETVETPVGSDVTVIGPIELLWLKH